MKNLITVLVLFALVGCQKEDMAAKLSQPCQEVYSMVWDKHFNYPPEVNFITIGDKISFYDVPIAETTSFEVESMSDYFTDINDQAQGVGVLFSGEGYTAKIYRKNGTTNYILAFVHKGSEQRMSMVLLP